MRILVISNFFPPHYSGGYELACFDVVQGLRARGHDVTVLTSTRGLRVPQVTLGAVRLLRAKPRSHGRRWARVRGLAADVWNRAAVAATVGYVRPDLIHVFNQSTLGWLMLDWLHGQSIPVVHDIFDTGLSKAFKGDLWFRRERDHSAGPAKLATRLTNLSPWARQSPSPLNFAASYCRSRYLKRTLESQGLALGETPIIYHGIRRADFLFSPSNASRRGIIFAGRLDRVKGVHVFLEALARLSPDSPRIPVTIVGGGGDTEYAAELRELASRVPAHVAVRFTGHLGRSEVVRLLREHLIAVFPVIWEEPFGISLLESMAAGLCVVATATGGATEILRDGENCVVVAKNDAQALADALRRLLTDDGRRLALAQAGQQYVEQFELDSTIDRVAAHLQHVAHSKPFPPHPAERAATQ